MLAGPKMSVSVGNYPEYDEIKAKNGGKSLAVQQTGVFHNNHHCSGCIDGTARNLRGCSGMNDKYIQLTML
jgi:hypothetical protein